MRIIGKKAGSGERTRNGWFYSPTGRLMCWYTFLFAVFFVVVFSPFWVYGRAFLWRSDGMGQHIPTLTYSRHWLKTVLQSLMRGKLEVPFWTMWLGFGQNTISNPINFRILNFLYALFPYGSLEFYLGFRSTISLYLTGVSFLVYGKTRIKSQLSLLVGSMVYTFSVFTIYFAARHTFFLEMTFALPLMMLGVDRIFEEKWSWLFIIIVALEGLSNFYFLFMITLPAVIYAFFHFFELTPEDRMRCGGFGRILLRHIVQYIAGCLLASVGLIPTIQSILGSSRSAGQSGISLLHWHFEQYLDFYRSIIGVQQSGQYGFVGLPSIALFALLYLAYTHKKRDRLLLIQVMLYTLAFLVPILTMVFSGFAGKTLRWSYIFSFWAAMTVACMIPRLHRDAGGGYRFSILALCVYAVIYLGIAFLTVRTIPLSLVLEFIGLAVIYCVFYSDWGKRRKRLAAALLFAMLLCEMTVKSYETYAPQYDNYIASFVNAGNLIEYGDDNPADALDMVNDDSDYRVDVITLPKSSKYAQMNYGLRNHVNGVSSYYSFSSNRIVSYSMDLGNSQQNSPFMILDLNQRTVLDELAGVKYVAAYPNALKRIPYGYNLVGERKKTRSDGSVTTEYLYRNEYALPLSYAYETYIPRQVYDELSLVQREQAMLQGVVLETDSPLGQTDLRFDDQVVMDSDEIWKAIKKVAKQAEYLEVKGNTLYVKKSNYNLDIPIDVTTGEIYFQFTGIDFKSKNYDLEKIETADEDDMTRLSVMAAKRAARKWKPVATATITVSSGSLSDDAVLYNPTQQYYFGKRNLLMNLGYGKTGGKVRLNFSACGEYSIDDMALIAQPMDSYASKLEPLQSHQAFSTSIDGNEVTVKYNLDNDAFACLAIPYSSDWHATVDGEKAEILPANGMYMGVYLTKGEHTIVFTNRPFGILVGAAVSLVTLHVLIVVYVVMKRRKRGAA